MLSHFLRERVLGATLFLVVALFALPLVASAADLNLSPASGSHAVDEEFQVKVLVDPSGTNINASDGTISYDSSVLAVTGISKDSSAFSLWTADPSYSNSAGTVSYSGGTPTAFSKQGTIITITFKGKKKGTAKVSVTKGSVLAADGKGTDVYKTGGEASYEITDAPAAPPDAGDSNQADSGDGGAVGPVPLAPNISSPTYPKEDTWYATSTGLFLWSLLPEDVDVRTLISSSDNDTPKQNLKRAATSTIVTKIPDGVSYFYAQVKNDSGWGAVGKRKIQVDTEPPKDFEVALIDGKPPKLSFSTTDDLSGMDRYEILLGTQIVATVPSAQITDGTYPVPPQEGGDTKVTIRAVDKAGNKKEAIKQLTLPKVEKPAGGDTPVVQTGFWNWERFFLIFMAMVLGGLIVWIVRTRNQAKEDRSRLLHRVAEVGDRNDRVFSAMREQFEQMVNDLDEKPLLTPAEREFLEETKEVLDIAEEQINSGIADLKRMVRGL